MKGLSMLIGDNHWDSSEAESVSAENFRLGHSAHLFFFLSHSGVHSFMQTGW